MKILSLLALAFVLTSCGTTPEPSGPVEQAPRAEPVQARPIPRLRGCRNKCPAVFKATGT